MKLFSLATISVLLFSGFSAFADFSGVWTGQGTLKTEQGSEKCSEITFEVKQSKLVLDMSYGYLQCGERKETIDPLVFVIHENHLVLNGQTVGTLADNAVDLDYVKKNGGVRMVINVTRDGNKMTYREVGYSTIEVNDQKNDQPVYTLEGELFSSKSKK